MSAIRVNEQQTHTRKYAGRRGYRGLTAEQLRQQRYDRLIAAGMELFGDRGYAASPIEAVCTHAKVSTRHFYEQFEGRESILHAVHDTIVDAMQQILRRQLTAPGTSLTQRVADIVEAAVLFLLEQPRRGRILCIESVGVSAVMEKKRRHTTHALAAVINRYAGVLSQKDLIPARDYHLPAIALVGMLNELIAEWLIEDTGLSPAEMAREAKILFRAMLFGAQHYVPTDSDWSDSHVPLRAMGVGIRA